jgi:dynein heavy chain
MIDFDKEHQVEKTVKQVQSILSSDDFTMEKVKAASNALVAIYKWSQAMLAYHELLKIVNPKRAKVQEMNDKLAIVRANLKEKLAKLKAVEEKIAHLQAMF